MIYLDYMSTTPIDDAVLADMLSVMGEKSDFANPASAHSMGKKAAAPIERARSEVSQAIGATPEEIIWTSGATESNNIAIQGAARFYKRQGKHIITTAIEHPAVSAVMQQLESEGFEVTYVKPNASGVIELGAVLSACRSDTILVSVMWVNNETGAIQPIADIAKAMKAKGIVFHVDAAQALGKCVIDLSSIPIDLLSLSAHKCYGPKGVGALFVRHSVKLSPILFGSKHENGFRPGTLATHQIVGMGSACRLLPDAVDMAALRDRLWSGLSVLPGVHRLIPEAVTVPHCLSVHIEDISVRALLEFMPELAISQGAACNAATMEPSKVLLAMGVKPVVAENSCRISLGRYLNPVSIDQAIEQFSSAVLYLRGLAPDTSDPVVPHPQAYTFGGVCENATHVGNFSSVSDGVSVRLMAVIEEGIIRKVSFLCQGAPLWLRSVDLFCSKLARERLDQLRSWSRSDWCRELQLADSELHVLQGLLTAFEVMQHEEGGQ